MTFPWNPGVDSAIHFTSFPSFFFLALRMFLGACGPEKSWRVICASNKSLHSCREVEGESWVVHWVESIPIGPAQRSAQGVRQKLQQILSLPREVTVPREGDNGLWVNVTTGQDRI